MPPTFEGLNGFRNSQICGCLKVSNPPAEDVLKSWPLAEKGVVDSYTIDTAKDLKIA